MRIPGITRIPYAEYTGIPYTSTLTINQKANGGTATSGFTNLFTVLQNGKTGVGTTAPNCRSQVYSGAVNVTNTSPYAVTNNYMANGSITIGV